MTTELSTPGFIRPDWPAPPNVHALVTLRRGGYSSGPYSSFNLAAHTDDDPVAVRRNRQLLSDCFQLPAEPVWLQQVHGSTVVAAAADAVGARSDGSWSDSPGQVCAVMTADCLPVLVCDQAGRKVAAAHAGWRGLHAGVITSAIEQLQTDAAELLVWLGPAIGPQAFEVGGEVVRAFSEKNTLNEAAFRQIGTRHWLCDLYRLARIELASLGITAVYGGDYCTLTDAERFYSYRRDGVTGRMASLIWLAP